MKNLMIELKYLYFLYYKCDCVGSRFSYKSLDFLLSINQDIAGNKTLNGILDRLFIKVPPIYMYGETDKEDYYLLKRRWCIVKDLCFVVSGIKSGKFFEYLKYFISDFKKTKERDARYMNPNR